MHEFRYKGNEFYCEDVRVGDIAEEVGTPVYIYSHKTLIDHYRKIKDAFKSINPLICFSMKSNSNLAVLSALVKEGSGLDIVSGGELYRAMKVGVDPKKIVYASVGKTDNEIKEAVKRGILVFNVESLPELVAVNSVCHELRKKMFVSIRVNPDVDPHTHKYITTGKKETKFGLDMDTAMELFRRRGEWPGVEMAGIHIHIGSQIIEHEPYVKAIKKLLPFIRNLKTMGVNLRWFNIGGGLGIVYKEEKPQTARDFARLVLPLLKKIDLKIILEPGRFIAGNSGILVTRVTYLKETKTKRFVIVDAGMNDLIRPSLYEAYHDIVPVMRQNETAKKIVADVVGPICESGDFLAKDRELPELSQGELLAVMGAGAYGFTMSSNYNSRPRAPEVMVEGDRFYIVRKRETYADLIKGESIPEYSG